MDYELLNRAMNALRDAANENMRAGYAPDVGGTRGYELGVVAQACEAAKDAIFEVLNVSANVLYDGDARAAIDARRPVA